MNRYASMLMLFFVFLFTDRAGAQEKLNSSKQIPILAWYSIPPEETTLARYMELKASGITYSYTPFPDVETMAKALQIAQKAGIKMIVACPELKTDTKKTVHRFMHQKAVAGYYLRDEPSRRDFSALREWAKDIQVVDNRHFCYLNLLPNYADTNQLGVKSYREYVHAFIAEVPIPLLSFDHYPVIGDSLRNNWYENLEIFADEARRAGKPFWAFALTVAHGPYPIPTIAQLRLQVFSDLAYGAQGIQYFTYWTPKGTQWDFHHGPITLEARRSEIYDRIKQVNAEIKHLSGVFLGSEVISVTHTGDSIPLGTKRLTTLPSTIEELKTKGPGALVSVLKKDNHSFLVIINRDFNHSMELMIKCKAMVRKVLKTGMLVPANAYIDTMNIDPGDMAIYTWDSKPSPNRSLVK